MKCVREVFRSSSDAEIDDTSVTPRWILSNLKNTFQHHISSICKIRKHGTILYRTDGDLLASLSKALHKTKYFAQPIVGSDSNSSKPKSETTAESINDRFRKQINKYLKSDKYHSGLTS